MADKKQAGKPDARGILAQFRASGLTQRAFAKQEGVPVSTLQYWLRREKLEREIAGDTALVAVTDDEEAKAPLSLTDFILEFGDIRIEVPRDTTAEEWRRLREAWAS